jgi:hypothetical protein
MTHVLDEWYIIKSEDGRCQILPKSAISQEKLAKSPQVWGPYASEKEAIARRVGLIRSNHCQPN